MPRYYHSLLEAIIPNYESENERLLKMGHQHNEIVNQGLYV